ncbi:MAG: hypothetical protein QM715_18585 [Nibricoccus sp.]
MAEKIFDAQMTLKMPKALLEGLTDIKKTHGLEPAEILRRLGESAVAFYREKGYFTFPIRLLPEKEFVSAVINTAETGEDRARLVAEETRRKATGKKAG